MIRVEASEEFTGDVDPEDLVEFKDK